MHTHTPTNQPIKLLSPPTGNPPWTNMPNPISTKHLQTQAEHYLTLGLSPSTRKTYLAGWRKFSTFCAETQLTPIPATKETLLLFAPPMAASRISHGSIKVCLSVIRHMHVLSGLHNDFSHQFTPRLQLALVRIKRSQLGTPHRTRLPITMKIMQKIKHSLNNHHTMTTSCFGQPAV